MRFSEKWLREWVDPAVDTAALTEQLTMSGLEVDAVNPVAGDFTGVVVARIETCDPHPTADRLTVCSVDAGDRKPRIVVCGAPNARAGLVAPLAAVGATLSGDKIKKARLRGVESQGMLCSEIELGLSDDAAGLMELADDAPVGTDLREYLQLDDHAIDLDLTPNRGDCLSMLGVAREVGAYYKLDRNPPDIPAIDASVDDTFPVELDDPGDCARFVGRVIRNIDPAARTPMWMKEKLRRAGIRPVSPVVDVTQYVMLELGQPMHAYDLDKLRDGIVVRRGQGEKLNLLDGREVEADEDVLVIADSTGAIGLAGIMGGANTAVTDRTAHLFLESAWFAPPVILGRARRYGMHTDASHRFERGVDPAHQARAVERATALLLDIVGGEPGPTVVTEAPGEVPVWQPVVLRADRLRHLLGVRIDDDEVRDILERLDMTVDEVEGGWKVTPPSARSDIAIEPDLVEEVGRIYGYNRIPSKSLSGSVPMPPLSDGVVSLETIRRALSDRGYQEAVTYSFVSGDSLAAMGVAKGAIELANPLSSDISVMRTSLLPGLLQALVYNRNRQRTRVRLFEVGKVFWREKDGVHEEMRIAGVATGRALPEQWGASARQVDFFDIKGDVGALCALTVEAERFGFTAGGPDALHPGQAATLVANGAPVGWLGRLHPAVAQKMDLSGDVFVFELRLEPLIRRRVPEYKEMSRFPSIRRDIALIFEENVTSGEILETVRRQVPAEMESAVILFDVFRGKNIGNARKSLTLGLILRAASRTLTDGEVDNLVAQVVAELQQKFKATLRE